MHSLAKGIVQYVPIVFNKKSLEKPRYAKCIIHVVCILCLQICHIQDSSSTCRYNYCCYYLVSYHTQLPFLLITNIRNRCQTLSHQTGEEGKLIIIQHSDTSGLSFPWWYCLTVERLSVDFVVQGYGSFIIIECSLVSSIWNILFNLYLYSSYSFSPHHNPYLSPFCAHFSELNAPFSAKTVTHSVSFFFLFSHCYLMTSQLPPEQQVHSIMASTIMSSFKGVEQTAAIAVLTDSHLRAVYFSNPVNQSTSQLVISSCPPSFKTFPPPFPNQPPPFLKTLSTQLMSYLSASPLSCCANHSLPLFLLHFIIPAYHQQPCLNRHHTGPDDDIWIQVS